MHKRFRVADVLGAYTPVPTATTSTHTRRAINARKRARHDMGALHLICAAENRASQWNIHKVYSLYARMGARQWWI